MGETLKMIQCALDAFQRRTGGSGKKYLPEINGGCVAVLDHDGDGRLDLFLGQAAPLRGYEGDEDFRDRLYRNLGDLSFEDVTAETGATEAGYTFHAAAPDLDAGPATYAPAAARQTMPRLDSYANSS